MNSNNIQKLICGLLIIIGVECFSVPVCEGLSETETLKEMVMPLYMKDNRNIEFQSASIIINKEEIIFLLYTVYTDGMENKLIAVKEESNGTYTKLWENKLRHIGIFGTLEIRDINKDNKSEIIVSWVANRSQNIWIYTWDDENNEEELITPQSLTPGVSGIVGLAGSVEMQDIDGDGIDEITVVKESFEADSGRKYTEEIYKMDKDKKYKKIEKNNKEDKSKDGKNRGGQKNGK